MSDCRIACEIESAGGRAVADRTDVADPEQVEAMVAGAVERFGGLDIGVNNAGIGGPTAPTGEYPLDGWRTVMSVNLDGVFYCTRAEIGPMRQRAGGSIVNMASILGAVGFANSVAYVAAKRGVVALTQERRARVRHRQHSRERGRPRIHPDSAARREPRPPSWWTQVRLLSKTMSWMNE